MPIHHPNINPFSSPSLLSKLALIIRTGHKLQSKDGETLRKSKLGEQVLPEEVVFEDRTHDWLGHNLDFLVDFSWYQ